MRKEINLSDGVSSELNILAKKRGKTLKVFIEDICEKVALEGFVKPASLLEFEMTDSDILQRWGFKDRIVKKKKRTKKLLTSVEIQAMVDDLRKDYPNGYTRNALELEKVFKVNSR